jgi:hypothetical protein
VCVRHKVLALDFSNVRACQSQVGESPTASYSEVDPCLGAVFRRSGMAICQAVKDMVLSRGRSPVIRQGEGWHRDSPVGRSGVEARSVLQPEELGNLRLVVRVSGDKGQKPKLGSRVEPHPSLPTLWDWLSGDVPDSLKGWWPNKPLQGHRVAIVAVPVRKLPAGSPEG